MRIIFAGTPEFAVPPLLALLCEHDVLAVYTQPDRRSGRGKKLTPPPVKVAAQQHDIPVFQPSSLLDQVSTMTEMRPDVIVVVAYGMLLPQAILDIPNIACINIHASTLPRWRGAAPIQRAIQEGDAETGVSIMEMALGLDSGPVYEMFKTEIGPEDTSATLHATLSELGARAITSTLRKLEIDPSLKAIEQDESHSNYARKILKSEADIDWTKSAHSIHCAIRAFVPWPVCQSHHLGNKIRIWKASVLDTSLSRIPKKDIFAGKVVGIDNDGVIVACGEGFLKLSVLQRDGSKALAFEQFSNGYGFTIGDQFGPSHGET